MKKALAAALFAAAFAAGCSSDNSKAARLKNPAPCPGAVVLGDAARIVEFDGEQRLEDVAYSAEILSARVACRYFGDKPIEASLTLDMAFGRGPKGEAEDRVFTYFVAVTRKDMEVIEKAEFQAPVSFGDDERVRVVEETVQSIVIPRASKDIAGTNFEVVVGWSMTPQQAIFNRSGKSLKFPEIK
jgi:hypothetical protein